MPKMLEVKHLKEKLYRLRRRKPRKMYFMYWDSPEDWYFSILLYIGIKKDFDDYFHFFHQAVQVYIPTNEFTVSQEVTEEYLWKQPFSIPSTTPITETEFWNLLEHQEADWTVHLSVLEEQGSFVRGEATPNASQLPDATVYVEFEHSYVYLIYENRLH